MVLGLSNSSELKIKVTSEKDCLQTLSVEWPAEKVKEKIEEAFVSVQGEAKMPGFRPGKTPIELIKKNFQDAAYARAQDLLLRDGVEEALKSKKINPIQSPVIQSMDFNPGKPFQFEFQVETAPKFKLTGYKGLKLTKTDKVVGEEDIKKALTNVADMNARLTESKDEVLGGTHFAVIDYEGFLEGKAIDGAKSQNFLLDMSAPQAIAGLADGLLGAKVNEEKDIAVTFPEDSPAKDLAGKKASFKVKLNAIKEKKVPNIDDELAKDMGFASLDELKSRIKENLENEAKTGARRELETQIIDKLLDENKFMVPPSLVEQQAKHIVERQKSRWDRQGIPAEDQVKLLANSAADLKNQAERDIRLAYVLDSVAETEKVAVTEEELNVRIEEIISKAEPQEKQSIQKALRGEFKSRIANEAREAKIFDFIVQNAKFK